MHLRDAPVYTNALRQEELLLRGARITQSHELAELRDCYDSLDLSNNDLRRLSGDFPTLKRLSGLLISHNKIAEIDEDFGTRLPRLEMLSLSHNELSDVSQLGFLRHMPLLQLLCLENNPITELVPDYRDHVVALQPHVRILDFERVRESDRKRALHKFGPGEQQTESKEIKAKRERLLAKLEKATDLAEIDALDKELAAL